MFQRQDVDESLSSHQHEKETLKSFFPSHHFLSNLISNHFDLLGRDFQAIQILSYTSPSRFFTSSSSSKAGLKVVSSENPYGLVSPYGVIKLKNLALSLLLLTLECRIDETIVISETMSYFDSDARRDDCNKRDHGFLWKYI